MFSRYDQKFFIIVFVVLIQEPEHESHGLNIHLPLLIIREQQQEDVLFKASRTVAIFNLNQTNMDKKITFSGFSVLILILLCSLPIYAQDLTFIPDPNFKNFLNSEYPDFMNETGDSLIADSAATILDTLDCSNWNINNMSGIECFKNIKVLLCHFNNLSTTPDLSKNTALEVLLCHNSSLYALPELNANINLRELKCYGNYLTSLPDLIIQS